MILVVNVTRNICETTFFPRLFKIFGFYGCVRDNLQKLFVGPHIIRVRRDIQVANQNARCAICSRFSIMPTEAFHKIEFVREFRVRLRVRYIPACRQVDIVQLDSFDTDCIDARMTLPAQRWRVEDLDGGFACNRHPVMPTALPINRKVGQPHLLEGFFGEFSVLAFDFLKADNVRRLLRHKSLNVWEAESD